MVIDKHTTPLSGMTQEEAVAHARTLAPAIRERGAAAEAQRRQPKETGEEEALRPAKTLLIAEDDAEVGAFLVQALKEEIPYQALVVPDSFQALKTIRTIRPDLFLLDYQLPSMDGLELYDHLHATEGLEQVPVLLMSADPPQHEIKQRGLHCLKKPFDLEELLQIVRELLEQ